MDGKTCFYKIIIGFYIHTMLLEASACKKRTPKVSTRGKELSIKPVGDSRMNYLEERGNDMIQARSNSDCGIKIPTVQFYTIEHNSKSHRWIELKLYQKIS